MGMTLCVTGLPLGFDVKVVLTVGMRSTSGVGLFSAGACSLSGEGGSGVGEQGVASGVPAGAGEGEEVDHEGRLVLGWLGGARWGFAAAVDDALVAQDAEADRIAAALGEEVAAEAEHVCPPAQAPPRS